MFQPDYVHPSERLKAGPGKSDRWRTSRVTEGVCLGTHPRRLSAIGTSRRLDGSGQLLPLLPETRSLDSGTPPLPSLELDHAAPLIQPPYRRLQLLRGEHRGGNAEMLKS